ncbi:hypothetical protein RAS1_23880 [Phycisphaerae bacterium RAS1]|nr:hypothetical protein RAS1_23880 [Phycisphaerae bacterium RAS1]
MSNPTANVSTPAAMRPSRLWTTIKALFRARITSGLLVILPIWVTYFLVKFVFTIMRDASQWAVNKIVPHELLVTRITESVVAKLPQSWRTWSAGTDRQIADSLTGWALAVISVMLTVFFLYLIGLLTANLIGKRALAFFESLLDRLPIIKTVYRSSKQILTTFGGEQSASIQRVALIPFLGANSYSIGFITNFFVDRKTGEEYVTLFLTTTPSPTTGYIMVCRRADVIEIDWSFEDAIKAIMSGGIILPETPSVAGHAPLPGKPAGAAPA